MKVKIDLKLLLFFICLACDPTDKLKVTNRSDDTIFFEISGNKRFNLYPIKTDYKGDTLWHNMNYSYPNDSVRLPLIGRNAWKDFILEQSPDSTLTIFIFDKKLLRGVVPDSLVRQQIYTKKYSYKVKDLEKLNWRIEYK